jgi:hypothetical protein
MMKISRTTLWVIALLSLAGGLAIGFSTRWGPWAYSDSTAYIVSARTFLEEGKLGYYVPSGGFERLTHHPPLYPLALSAIGLFGVELLDAARWLNVVLFSATIFATGAFTYRLLRSSWLAISLSTAMFAIPSLVDIYSGAMSEPLCLFTSVVGTFMLVVFLETRQRRYLILAASAAGMAFLTRYIGVFAIATGLITLLIFNRSAWKERLVNLIRYGLVSVFPNAIWWLYVYLNTASYGARQVVARADLGKALIELRLLLMEVFWNWLPFTKDFTYSYNLALKILLLLGLLSLLPVGLVIRKWWKDRQAAVGYRQELTFFLTWCIFSLAYLAFLAYAYIFTTPVPDVDLRMLLPMQIGLLMALLSAGLLMLRALRIPAWGSLGVIALVLVYLAANLPSSLTLVREYSLHGGGYTSLAWHQSNTLEALNRLPADTPIITNQAAAVLLWTDRSAYDFCSLPCNQPENPRYGDNPDDEVQRIFRQQGAALVLFYPFCASRAEPWNLVWMAQVEELTRGLTTQEFSCDGAIYFYP